jgi:phosphonate transport system ATP-binding protein
MNRTILQAESLGYGARVVLRGVTFTLVPGERVVLLGRSGEGKTTLLNAIYDRLIEEGQRVALVPQDHALVPPLSVVRNVLMGRLDDHGPLTNLASLLHPRRRDRAVIKEILAELGLSTEADRAVEGLSGGQKQRTALARALFRGGRVLIGDEPVSAVDSSQAVRLLTLAQERFPSSVLALHDVDLACAFATRLIGLRSGSIVFDAGPEQVTAGDVEALYAA